MEGERVWRVRDWGERVWWVRDWGERVRRVRDWGERVWRVRDWGEGCTQRGWAGGFREGVLGFKLYAGWFFSSCF